MDFFLPRGGTDVLFSNFSFQIIDQVSVMCLGMTDKSWSLCRLSWTAILLVALGNKQRARKCACGEL